MPNDPSVTSWRTRETVWTGRTGTVGVASSRNRAVTQGGSGVDGEIDSSTGPMLGVRNRSPALSPTSIRNGSAVVSVALSGCRNMRKSGSMF